MTKIFKVPFATQGDRTSIPDDVQADGAVSYTQGYSYDYERDQQTDPAAKDIEREKMNGIFHDITEAVGELQSFGFLSGQQKASHTQSARLFIIKTKRGSRRLKITMLNLSQVQHGRN